MQQSCQQLKANKRVEKQQQQDSSSRLEPQRCRNVPPGCGSCSSSPKLVRPGHMGESWGELASWLALQQSSPEVIAGSVDDRLQMMIHRDQLRGGAAVGLSLWRQRLPENHLQALRRKTRPFSKSASADHYHRNRVRNSPFFQLVYPEKPERSSRWTSGWEQPENTSPA